MAASNNLPAFLGPDTLVVIKISVNDSLKKLKLPLRDLGANVLLGKLRHSLKIDTDQRVLFERFSDSAGGFVELDPNNAQVFKTLLRAAKAKLKLRLKATFLPPLPPIPLLEEQSAATVPEPSLSLPPPPPPPTWRLDKHASINLYTPDIVPPPPPPPAMIPAPSVVPVIVRSPKFHDGNRESTALDSRSVGNGIFEFRDAQMAKQQSTDSGKVDTKTPSTGGVSRKPDVNTTKEKSSASILQRLVSEIGHGSAWSVYCNECDAAMADAHYHCNICDCGDYDLCESCVAAGKLCPGDGHWLIKRFIKDGNMVTSTTERLSPRGKPCVDRGAESAKEKECSPPPPAPAMNELEKVISSITLKTAAGPTEPPLGTRTCNNCVKTDAEHEFVTCKVCRDFDLCIACHVENKHGHHPAHAFRQATDKTTLTWLAEELLSAGRRVRHNAICDGCNKKIVGVRHKCLTCPDYDYCSDCVGGAHHSHPRHRFAPLYEPIPDNRSVAARHIGVFCDGPLCKGTQNYITGTRYKCAVCHDTDFCAPCEALPKNTHNRTHPLIMFKTPVRGVSISTINEGVNGAVRALGDRTDTGAGAGAGAHRTKTAASTADTSSPKEELKKIYAAKTLVQTVAEIEPTAASIPVAPAVAPIAPATSLQAFFVCDNHADGTPFKPGTVFTHKWTLRNPGPTAWPAGCSVRFVGGDNMLNIDNDHPCSLAEMEAARETNVVGREVNVGEEVAFKITLRAPIREGAHISYWRLKTADGTPFGHRLWCDIRSRNPSPEEFSYPLRPAPMAAEPAESFAKPPTVMPELYRSTLWEAEQQRRRLSALQQEQQIAIQQQRLLQYQKQLARQGNGITPGPAGYPYSAGISPALPSYPYSAGNQPTAVGCPFNNGYPPAPVGYPYSTHRFVPPQGSQMPVTHSDSANRSTVDNSEKLDVPDRRARQESVRQRVEDIRARIMRAREERTKEAEESNQAEEESLPDLVDPNEEIPAVAPEGPVTEEVEEVEETTTHGEETNLQGSQMVFPKLEKESPASSTYQSFSSGSKGKAAYVENEDGVIEQFAAPSEVNEPAPAPPSPAHEGGFEDLTDDLEVLSANDEQSDDGFHTDEEYDILDASDRETVASP